MARLVIRVIEESYDSQVCVFEHNRYDDSVVLKNDPKTISDSVEELEAAVSYLKSIQNKGVVRQPKEGRGVSLRENSMCLFDDLQKLQQYLPTKDDCWQETENICLDEIRFYIKRLEIQDLSPQEQLLLDMLEQTCEAYHACKKWAHKPQDF